MPLIFLEEWIIIKSTRKVCISGVIVKWNYTGRFSASIKENPELHFDGICNKLILAE